MSVAARFRVSQITKHAHFQADAPSGEVKLQPDLSKGNEDWARYTPSGEITMNVNGPAFPWFEEHLGQVLALTFDEVPA